MAEKKTDRGRVIISWKTRTIHVSGEIDERTAHRVIYGITKMTSRNVREPILLILNSHGGLEVQGFAIYDALRACPARVVVEGYGNIQSIATAIMMGGDWRRIAPNATFMIHDGNVEVGEATTAEIEDHLAFKVERDNRYHQVLAERTGRELETIETWCREDEHWFSPEDAVENGFCDEIIKPATGAEKWTPKK